MTKSPSRTPRRFATTAAVAGLAAFGLIAPSTASATGIDGYGASVQHAAVSSLAADAHITAAEATARLRAQQAATDTVHAVTGALGQRAAGGYLDATGAPTVNVLDTAAADQARAAGAVAKIVRHSTAQLADAQHSLQSLPAVTHTAIGVDEQANRIVVTVSDAAKGPALDRLLAAARGFGDRVAVEHVTGAMHTAIYNGEAITGGGTRCSVGFNTNKGGQNYIVDAGHCTRAVSQWNVGPSVNASFPGNDYGLIRNTNSTGPGEVSLYNGSTQRISSAATATVGERICKSGSTTHLTCGSVTRTNVTVNYQEGSVSQLIQTSASVNPGDSGGCLFDGSKGLGITSGMGGGSSFFQPVGEALSAYGVSLN